MVIIVLSQVLNNNLVPDCIKNNRRGSKFLGRSMSPDPPNKHADLRLHEHTFSCTTIILLPSFFFPPLTQNPV